MSNIKQILEEKVAEFNSRIKDEPKYSGVIEGKERSICISVSNGNNYISNLKDMQLEEFKESDDKNKDLVVTATSDVLISGNVIFIQLRIFFLRCVNMDLTTFSKVLKSSKI